MFVYIHIVCLSLCCRFFRYTFTLRSNCFIFAVSFQGFAYLQIILSWLSVFDKLNKTFPEDPFYISEKKLKYCITTTISVIVVLLVTLASIKAVAELAFVYAMAALGLTLCYLVGFCRFRNKVKAFLGESMDDKERRAVALVKRSFEINAVCLFVVGVAAATYYYGFTSHLEVIPADGLL